ncbi:MAG: hypothetical protein GF384_02940 [Elusimicrobia bacterium]|nr:hypothetical protein [Elusimicrobiota bacterium]
MQQPPYRFIDHTADIGITVYGESLEQLFINAARGMVALMINGPAPVTRTRKHTIHCAAVDKEMLLTDWLQELLYRFYDKHLIPGTYGTCTITPSDNNTQTVQLVATLSMSSVNPDTIKPVQEIKAVTHHNLSIEQKDRYVTATIIFDV